MFELKINNLYFISDIVKRVLEKVQCYDKILTIEELESAEAVIDVLEFFEKTTTTLSGSEYPTLSIAVLMKLEIIDM